MKRVSHTRSVPSHQVASSTQRRLPLVDLIVDTRAELVELAVVPSWLHGPVAPQKKTSLGGAKTERIITGEHTLGYDVGQAPRPRRSPGVPAGQHLFPHEPNVHSVGDPQERAGTLTHCGAGVAHGCPGLHANPPFLWSFVFATYDSVPTTRLDERGSVHRLHGLPQRAPRHIQIIHSRSRSAGGSGRLRPHRCDGSVDGISGGEGGGGGLRTRDRPARSAG